MAIADWAAFVAAFESPRDRVFLAHSFSTSVTGRMHSAWTNSAPFPGSAPTTAVVPTKATTGTSPFDAWGNSGGGLATYCVGGDVQMQQSNGSTFGLPGFVLVCDRLSHQGGLSGITTGAQTTNLPTAALTRYTSGVGVMAAVEIYTQVGATQTTITASYTNTAAASGQATPLMLFGGTGFREGSRFFPLPLQVGDVGVTAVASVTLAATTGTAGNFGVTLYKPLMALNVSMLESATDPVLSGRMFGGIPEIADDACLFFVWQPTNVLNSSIRIQGSLSFAEA